MLRAAANIRPELASVCHFLAANRRGRVVRPSSRRPLAGILAELAETRGRP